MIQSALLEQVATFALSRIDRAEYVVDGVVTDANIYLKDIVDDTKIRIWVTIPAAVNEITEVRVYDPDDALIIWELETKTLTPSRVTYVRFQIDAKELLA